MSNQIYQQAAKYRNNELNLLEELVYRWSARSMTGKQIEKKLLLKLIEAASYAPSSYNEQPWCFFYALRQSRQFEQVLSLLVEANQDWAKKAAALIILVSKKQFTYKDKDNRHHSFDSGAAWQSLAIQACKENLVVHAMAGFDLEASEKYLDLSEEYQVECVIAVGIPSEQIKDEKVSSRKKVGEIAIDLAE